MAYRQNPYDDRDRRPSYNRNFGGGGDRGGEGYGGPQGGGGGGGRWHEDDDMRRRPPPNYGPHGGGPGGPGGPAGEREKPSRTLFVRNISYDTPEQTVRELFEKYGHIKRSFSLIQKRGMLFVSYYDLRAADRAKREMNGVSIGGRQIDVHYSLPKDEEQGGGNPEEMNTGSIFAILKDTREIASNFEFKQHFSQWGEVREVRDSRSPGSKFIEYWDLRDSDRAVKEAPGSSLKGGRVECRFAFNTGMGPTQQPPQPQGGPMRRRDDWEEREPYRGGDRGYERRDEGRGYNDRPPYDDYNSRHTDNRAPAPQSYNQPPPSNTAAQQQQSLLGLLPLLGLAGGAPQPPVMDYASLAADPNAAALAQLSGLLSGVAGVAPAVAPAGYAVASQAQPANPNHALAGLAAILQLAQQQQPQAAAQQSQYNPR